MSIYLVDVTCGRYVELGRDYSPPAPRAPPPLPASLSPADCSAQAEPALPSPAFLRLLPALPSQAFVIRVPNETVVKLFSLLVSGSECLFTGARPPVLNTTALLWIALLKTPTSRLTVDKPHIWQHEAPSIPAGRQALTEQSSKM